MKRLRLAGPVAVVVLLATSAHAQVISLTDVSPARSSRDAIDPDAATGGRVNGTAVDPNNPLIMYAASEWGGIYKTTDGGVTWGRLNGHRPTATWDVEVNPGASNIVYATSFYDGRSPALSGINVSYDGGATWIHPITAAPPPGFCANSADRTELTAFGITVDPSNPSNVYIGTSCGLAVSNDSGASWFFTAPVFGAAGRIWDAVVASAGNFVDTCGDAGHRYYDASTDTWTAGSGLPSGLCSIVASPYAPGNFNMIATVGGSIFETEDGLNWVSTRTNPSFQGRIPFVATNKRSLAPAGQKFDLWFGDTSLHRVTCDAAAAGPNCGTGNSPAWSGPYTRTAGAHDDTGSILFNPGASNDACPILMSSDGGVYYNTLSTSPACHDPVWEQPMVSPHGLWPFSLSGADRSGADDETLYFGNQDNGVFGTTNAGTATPVWSNDECCDSFDATASPSGTGSVLYSVCCFNSGRATNVRRANPDFSGRYEINYPATGLLPGFQFPDVIARWGDKKHAMLTVDCTAGTAGCPGADGGLYVTTDIEASTITWTELGSATEPQQSTVGVCSDYPPRSCTVPPGCGGSASCFVRQPCAVYTAADAATFYEQTGNCNGDGVTDQMWRFSGTAPAGTWTQISLPGGEGFGVFAVDPANANRLIASGVTPTGAAMYRSGDGGTSWTAMTNLTALMNGGGDFPMKNQRGVTNFTQITGYHQPSFAAFDPFDASNIIAGGRDSGVFYSIDDGANWSLVTDPRNSHASGIPHLPRPRHAYFSEADHNKSIYVSSQGRGIWRLAVCNADTSEPDDSPSNARALVPGVPLSRSICATHDQDWAAFTLTESAAVHLETSGGSGDTLLYLWDSAFNLLASDDDSGVGNFSLIDRTCGSGSFLAAGTYYVLVGEYGSNDTIAEYTLSLTVTPCCGNATIDAAETCDDGNRNDGDCCAGACVLEPGGSPCVVADGCTINATCNGFGSCSGTRPSTPAGVGGLTMPSTVIEWPAVPLATSYDAAVGDLNALRSSGGDFQTAMLGCIADELPDPVMTHLGITPPVDDGYFFVVRAGNCGGPGTYDEGSPSQVGSRDAEIQAGAFPCTNSCTAGRCVQGSVFTGACAGDACVNAICAVDPFCCQIFWDGFCVQEVRTVCSSLTCRESAPSCSHTACSTGLALASGCDSPPVTPSCVAAICTIDPFCCGTAWDGLCVNEVNSVCGLNCS